LLLTKYVQLYRISSALIFLMPFTVATLAWQTCSQFRVLAFVWNTLPTSVLYLPQILLKCHLQNEAFPGCFISRYKSYVSCLTLFSPFIQCLPSLELSFTKTGNFFFLFCSLLYPCLLGHCVSITMYLIFVEQMNE
jgi:hypothetical protein